MRKSSLCVTGSLGLVVGLSLILLGSCEDSHPTSVPNDKGGFSAATPPPPQNVSPTPTDMPGTTPPPRQTPGGGGATPPPGDIKTIQIMDSSFTPDPAEIKTGQPIVWHNAGSDPHSATSTSGGFGGFDTGLIKPGDTSKAIKLTKEGTFEYRCKNHPAVGGTVNVTR
jgi:plastocyanin